MKTYCTRALKLSTISKIVGNYMFLAQKLWLRKWKRIKEWKKSKNVSITWCSQAVTHPSTNHARRCLTSVIGRELVLSPWYERWRLTVKSKHHICTSCDAEVVDNMNHTVSLSRVNCGSGSHIVNIWCFNVTICRQCSYHGESTSSRPITEVKHRRAWLVLGWVTAWEHHVMLTFPYFFPPFSI